MGWGSPSEILRAWKELNHNVRLVLVIVVFAGVSESLGFGTSLAAYLYMVNGDKNADVGYLESCMGVTKLLTALPIGDIADRYGRDITAKMGSVAYVIAAGITLFAIMAEKTMHPSDSHIFIYWAVALSLWGFGKGVVDGPVLALFADSVPTGERSRYYMYLFVMFWAGALAGPLIAIMIFQLQSNSWTLNELAIVLIVALALKLANASLLCYLSDNKSLGAEADHIEGYSRLDEQETRSSFATDASGDVQLESAETVFNALRDRLDSDGTLIMDSTPEEHTVVVGLPAATTSEDDMDQPRLSAKATWLIPRAIFAASLVAQLGAGMTVKFFPLFFMNDCRMSPTGVQAVYLGVPIIMLICGKGSAPLAKKYGRIQTIFAFKAAGTACLFLFVWLQRFRSHWIILVPSFLLQTGLMDATFPLEESTLMDFVPKQQRGRWKSLESVAKFGWCGSAMLGGVLVDKFDYTFTFLLTAIIQSFAVLIWAMLLPIVPKEELRASSISTRDSASTQQKQANSETLSEHLLEGHDEQ